jgi:adenylate cyclase
VSQTRTGNKSPGFARHPDYRVDLVREGGRVRIGFNGITVADSADVVTVKETGHDPVLYFPREDVRTDLLRPTEHHSHCPFKGQASYWTLAAGDRSAENLVWSYEEPYDETMGLRGLMAFYADRVEVSVEPR